MKIEIVSKLKNIGGNITMKKMYKFVITVLLLFLFVGLGNVNANAATINIGESKTGTLEYGDDKDFIFRINQPMKVKITLTLGENQDTDFPKL